MLKQTDLRILLEVDRIFSGQCLRRGIKERGRLWANPPVDGFQVKEAEREPPLGRTPSRWKDFAERRRQP